MFPHVSQLKFGSFHGQTAPMAVTSKFEEASLGCHSCGESAPVPLLDHQIQSLSSQIYKGCTHSAQAWIAGWSPAMFRGTKHLSKREAKLSKTSGEMENDGKAITKSTCPRNPWVFRLGPGHPACLYSSRMYSHSKTRRSIWGCKKMLGGPLGLPSWV